MREEKTDTVGRKLNCEGKPRVAFICVHNSCRSQIAEALGKKLASDVFDSYSAVPLSADPLMITGGWTIRPGRVMRCLRRRLGKLKKMS